MRDTSSTCRSKIKTIRELAEIVATLRAQDLAVVHCHGVFDLVHIGHTRHFERAKRKGDVLIVTVTPDRYVNKGPQRPAFLEELRAEAVAALGCVDYVAINEWPLAVEAIRTLRPNFYVKGSDYRDAGKDQTGGIVLEREAIEGVGGELVFTDEISFSSSGLINQYLPVFAKEVSDYLAGFSTRYSFEDIVLHVERLKKLKVLLIGETIVDEYQYCEAIGKSSKEPMLALRLQSMEKFAGGIAAVANNVANFCDGVGQVTFLGAQSSQEEFIRQQLDPSIVSFFLYRPNSPTIVKRRFIESYFFTKLLEIYEMDDRGLNAEANNHLCATLDAELPKYDLALVVDFGHGMLSREAIDILAEKANFLAVNAQSNAGNLGFHTISKYPRADLICIAEKEIRLEARDRQGDLRAMTQDVASRLRCDSVIVTRGSNGCLCYGSDEGFIEIPALAGQVIDRMGAGDSFLSLAAPCAASGVPLEVVGFIGNAAGAQAVATVGHRRHIERRSLFRQIEYLLK